MTVAETEAELRAWLDRLAIQDLIYRHSDATTRADWKQCEALYAPDAIWENGVGLRYENRAALMDMLEGTSAIELIVQTAHAPVVTLIDSGNAKATTTIHEWLRGVSNVDTDIGVQKGEETSMEVYGVYYDDIAKINGEWKFTHRLYVPIYMATGVVTGDVVTPRSALLRPQ